ncbi:MAG: PilZ domain-containing protein [Pseudobacteriovorax sp.]|nr:PilZ domain-containing protein [Pseudobacteriovorax sp.]
MNTPTLKILFIDEKRITSDLDKAGYRKVGAQIFQATSFQTAKDVLETQEISVIVINYDFKESDPVAICTHLKQTYDDKPIVMTSVQNVPKKILRQDHGPDLFIEQPIPRQYFIEKIRSLLEEKIRDTDRVSHRGIVEFRINGAKHECPIQDISKSGILVATEMEIKNGTLLDLSFSIPGYKKPIKVSAEVVRKIAANTNKQIEAGLGVRFREFSGDSQKRLDKYILKSQNDDPKLVYYL